MKIGGRRPASLGALVMLVISLSVLALAIDDALLNWVLYSDGLLRRVLF